MPAKILEIVDPKIPLVKVAVAGGLLRVLPSLLEDPVVGDYVTVYAGAVIERVDTEGYNNRVKLWREIEEGLSQIAEQEAA